jgi:hypothetical protein
LGENTAVFTAYTLLATLMEIETALASGGGDDEAIEDMIVNSS